MQTMKAHAKLTFSQSTATMLLLVFVGFFVSISFFKHKHLVNGVLIVHSHPFSPTENHSHSADATNLIQHLSHFESKSVGNAYCALNESLFIRIVTASTANLQLALDNFQYHVSRPPPTPFI